ncbi:Uncharacterised protein [Burkholderia pseudomallei]|nr:Uncharacterised protein [Burkholderia pseudomallei]
MRHPYMMTNQNRTRRQMNGTPVLAAVPSVEADEAPQVGRKSPVHWRPEEKMLVARAMRKLRTDNPSLSNLVAARVAQREALPPDRQRVLVQERQVTELIALIREIAVQESLAQRPKPAPVPQVVGALASTGFESTGLAAALSQSEPASGDKRRVYWTVDEKRVIALESKRLRSVNVGMTRLDAIRNAVNSELPPERRREVRKFDTVDWIEDEWKAIEDAERAERAEREAREQAAELERQAEESRRAIEAARAEAEKAKAIDPASLPLETLIGALGVRIAGMLLRSIGEQLQESIMQRITEALGNVTLPSPGVLPEGATRLHAAPRDRKPRVLVVGLVRQQEDDVSRALGELFRFDYARVEHADNLEEKARGADLVVLMTKFISHKHQDIVRRVNEHIVYRNGGVTELKRWLTQWINGEVITASA